MKIRYFSDIHLEFGKFKYEDDDSDVVVIAGDLGVGKSGLAWIKNNMKNKPVIYVAGNHEFYTNKYYLQKLYNELAIAAKGTNIHFLQNESVVIDGVNFIGATLWTDYDLYGNQNLGMWNARQRINDYQLIHASATEIVWPDHLLDEHKKSVQSILTLIDRTKNNVIVTHHSPTEKSLDSRYENSSLNVAYASNLEKFIQLDPSISTWIHGHTHASADIQIGQCRVVCNPRGYVGHELNHKFDPKKSIIIKV